ncbi:MAG TPA: hypothetical protein VI588_00140, partial [Candidatus Gracilibacteria bacterium]|nr:hypothetical protein [Candidatus Gracilibacteria bacterium]
MDAPPPPPETVFQELREKVLEKRPVLRQILYKRGGKNLYEYAKEYISVNSNPPIQKRQTELIGTLKKQVAGLLGDEVAASVADQMAKYYYVSTADHHGPICSPFFLSSNLIASAPYTEYPDPLLKYLIVVGCSNISFDNSSFPRGLLFNSFVKGHIEMNQLAFFSRDARPCPVFNYRGYSAEDIAR